VPELPEVETVRRRLEPVLVGRTFEHVDIDDARLVRPYEPAEVAAELSGERVAAVERRGKYLIVRFESGRVLLVHLRMTGSFRHDRRGRLQDVPHRRAVVNLENGSDVAYRDVRRFGTWLLLEPPDVEPYLAARVGPEPLGPEFTTAFLQSRLAGRAAPLKAAILDQRTVAGLGNIYADEALWRARLHPRRTAGSLTPDEIAELRRSIRAALRRGIATQGADLGDGVYASGSMQHEFKVYGCSGQPCDRCGTIIAKTVVGGRGTSFCPTCQAASSASSRPSRSSIRSSS
jgi:formamidopyrimidine-DNA glycosylase